MLSKNQKKRVPVRSLFHHVMRSKLYGILTINSMEGLIHELDNLLPVEMEKDNIDPFAYENKRYQNDLFPSSHGDHLDRALKSLGKDLGIPVSIDLVNTQAVKRVIMSIAKNVDDNEKNQILEWLNMPNEVIMKSQRYQDFINQACITFYKKPASEINEDTVGFIRRSANELLRNKASKEALRKRLMKPDDSDNDMDLKMDSNELLKSLSPDDSKSSKMLHKYDMPKNDDTQQYSNTLSLNMQNVPLPVSSSMNQHMLSMPTVNQHIPNQIPVISMNPHNNQMTLNLQNPLSSLTSMSQLQLAQSVPMSQNMQNSLPLSMHHDVNSMNTMNHMGMPMNPLNMNMNMNINMNMNTLGNISAMNTMNLNSLHNDMNNNTNNNLNNNMQNNSSLSHTPSMSSSLPTQTSSTNNQVMNNQQPTPKPSTPLTVSPLPSPSPAVSSNNSSLPPMNTLAPVPLSNENTISVNSSSQMNPIPQQSATLPSLLQPTLTSLDPMNMNAMHSMNSMPISSMNSIQQLNGMSEKRIPDIDPLGSKRKNDNNESI